jgi:light-regulated signal transduction histidine kinase (bacteriophytochrome)
MSEEQSEEKSFEIKSEAKFCDSQNFQINEINMKMKMLTHICSNLENEKQELFHNLKTCKTFLNMVIHDMRSPTNSIQMAISKVISKLDITMFWREEHLKYQENAKVLLE